MSDKDSIQDDLVSEAYQSTSQINVPSALDDAILAASRREVKSRPGFIPNSWKMPVSIAAVVTLSVSLVFTMYDELGEPLLNDSEELIGAADTIQQETTESIKAIARAKSPANNQGMMQKEVIVADDSVLYEEFSDNTVAAIAPAPATPVAEFDAQNESFIEDKVASASATVVADETEELQRVQEQEAMLASELVKLREMKQELEVERQEIQADISVNESRRSEAMAKVDMLKARKSSAIEKKRKVAAKKALVKEDPWLLKIKELWKNDNKELAQIELARYLEVKEISKDKLKGRLPVDLLQVESKR